MIIKPSTHPDEDLRASSDMLALASSMSRVDAVEAMFDDERRNRPLERLEPSHVFKAYITDEDEVTERGSYGRVPRRDHERASLAQWLMPDICAPIA